MSFVENNHMVKTFPAKCADDAFGNRILPWTSRGGWCVFQAELVDLNLEFFTKDFVIISDDIFCGFIESKSFTKLLNSPLRVRACTDTKVQYFASIM